MGDRSASRADETRPSQAYRPRRFGQCRAEGPTPVSGPTARLPASRSHASRYGPAAANTYVRSPSPLRDPGAAPSTDWSQGRRTVELIVPYRPPPAPADHLLGHYSVNPLGRASFAACAPTARVLGRIPPWRGRSTACRTAAARLPGGDRRRGPAVPLTATARAMTPLLGAGADGDRLRAALSGLFVVACASATAPTALDVARYAERRITCRLTPATDTALVKAVCRVEAAACGSTAALTAGSRQDRRDAYAGHGDGRQRFLSALIRVVTAGAFVTVLTRWCAPLLLAVAPARLGDSERARPRG